MKYWLALALLAVPALGDELSKSTLERYQAYMADADAAVARRAAATARLDAGPDGRVAIESHGLTEIHSGLIHDWAGAVFVRGAKVSDAVAVLQDVDRYKSIYSPEVTESRLIRREDDRLRFHMRVVKKKVLTVVLDTEYDVDYRRLPNGAVEVVSRSGAFREVESAGKPEEHLKPADTGYGFLWRLNSYWLIEAREGGVYMECRAISLTRDIPHGLGWIVKPMVSSLPRESIEATLEHTRRAILARLE